MAISRLFFEISGDSSKLNQELKKAIDTAKSAGVEITRAGQSFISKFDEALNPTKRLAEQIDLLQKAGKSNSDIMKVMGDQIRSATEECKKMGQPVDDLVKRFTSLGSRMKTAGEEMMIFGKNWSMYVTAPIMAVGVAVFKAGEDYEKGLARIRIGTGATGDQLKALAKDFTEVWGQTPASAEQVGQAIADLNSRLGLTGKPLEEMSVQMLRLARMTHSEVTPMIAAATRMFGDWSVAATDQSKALDYVFRASQSTGIGMQQLLEIIVQFGAPMRSLGFTLDQAAALMGKWEKEGVNMETVLAGLRFALGNFAKAGADPIETLRAVQAAIKNAKTESEATAIAFQVFGKKAAVDMGRAILEGRFDIEQLVKTISEGRDTINQAAEDSATFGSRMEKLQQQTEKALVPIAEKLLKAFEDLQPMIVGAIDKIAGLAKAFAELDPWLQKAILGGAALLAAIGPLSYTIGAIVKASSGLVNVLAGAGGGLVGLMTTLGYTVAAVGAAWAGWKIGRWISDLFDLDEKLGKVWTKLGLFQGGLKESNDALAKTNLLQYTKLTKDYSDEIQKLHLNIEKGNKTDQEWSDTLTKAFIAIGNLHPAVKQASATVKTLGTSGSDAAGGLGMLDESLKKLKENLEKNARPADELAGEMKKLIASGAPIDEVLAGYAEKLMKAAEQQSRLHQAMKPATKALVDQAGAFYLVLEAEKAAQEGMPDILKGLFDEMEKAAKQAKEDLEKAREIVDIVNKETAKGKTEELELQKAILDATIPQTEEQRKMLEAEKDRLDYEIKSQEIQNKYVLMRLDIFKKMQDMDPFGEAYHKALDALNQLDKAEQSSLENIAARQGAEIIRRHQEEYQRMVDGIKQGAGEIFDVIARGGKDAFSNLKDWIKDTFLSSLKKLFENFIASIVTDSKGGLGKIFAGIIPGISGGNGGGSAPIPGQWGNTFGGGTAGGSNPFNGTGPLISFMNGAPGTIPQKPFGSDIWDTLFKQGSAGSFGSVFGAQGMSGKAGWGPGNQLMTTAGAMSLFAGIQGRGVGSVAESILGGAAMGAGIGSVIPGLGTAIGAAIGAGIGILSKSIQGLIGMAQGKNTYQASSDEIKRDFGGVSFSEEQSQAAFNSMGFNEADSWKWRGFIQRSPVMIQQLAGAAQQQGKMGEFLKSLEPGGKGSWGMDMKTPVEIGMITGDWSDLNDVFKDLSQNEEHFKNFVEQIGPDMAKNLLIQGEDTDKLLNTFKNMRQAITESVVDPLSKSIDQFMTAGKVTDALRESITKLGGDMAAFDKVANLSQLNGYFAELVQHFKDTGEMLPDLTRIAGEYGANVDVLTDAVDKLTTLRKTASTVSSLQGSLNSMAQQFDPIQQMLQGQWNSRIETALSGAGLDPARFAGLSTAIRASSNWDNTSNQALQGGIINKDLQDALANFGGDEGQLALQMYRQGFNTLTQDLLDKTKEAMDRSYEQSIQDALDYLGNVGDDTNEQISALTSTVEEQLQIAGDKLEEAVNNAKDDVVDALDKILIAIYEQGSTAGGTAASGSTANNEDLGRWAPSLADGGEVLKTGLAIVHEGEHFDGGKGFGPQVTLQNCTIYGYDDFVEKVRQAGIDLERRAFA